MVICQSSNCQTFFSIKAPFPWLQREPIGISRGLVGLRVLEYRPEYPSKAQSSVRSGSEDQKVRREHTMKGKGLYWLAGVEGQGHH